MEFLYRNHISKKIYEVNGDKKSVFVFFQQFKDKLTCSLVLDLQYSHLSAAPGPSNSYIFWEAKLSQKLSSILVSELDVSCSKLLTFHNFRLVVCIFL